MVLGVKTNPTQSLDRIKTQLYAEHNERKRIIYKQMMLIFLFGSLFDIIIWIEWAYVSKNSYFLMGGIILALAVPFWTYIPYWTDTSYFQSMIKMLNWNTNYLVSLCRTINGSVVGTHLEGASYYLLLIKGTISDKPLILTYRMGYPPFRWLEIGIPLKNKINGIDMANKKIMFGNKLVSIPNTTFTQRPEIDLVDMSMEMVKKRRYLYDITQKDPLYYAAYQSQVVIRVNNFPKSDFMDTSSEPVPMNDLILFLKDLILALDNEVQTELVTGGTA